MALYRTRQQAQGTLVDVLYTRVGRGTALLAQALPGQKVGLVGPLGRCFELPGAAERALLVAGGTGIASVYELAARLVPRVDVCVLLAYGNGLECKPDTNVFSRRRSLYGDGLGVHYLLELRCSCCAGASEILKTHERTTSGYQSYLFLIS